MHVLHTVGGKEANPQYPQANQWLVFGIKKKKKNNNKIILNEKKKKTSPITDHITPCVLTSCRLRPLKTIENHQKPSKTVENRRKPSTPIDPLHTQCESGPCSQLF